jgi:glutathione S-transferase
MELFYSRISGNSARAVFGMTEAGIDWTPHPLDPRAGQTRTAEYLAINPMGKIPALKDGDFVLWESNAINWYVCETHPEAGLLPATPRARAAVQRWVLFQAAHVSPACLPIFRGRLPIMQSFWKAQPDPAAVASAEKELGRFLPVLEAGLGDKEWLEGAFSLADVAYASHLYLLRQTGYQFSPRLGAWLDRLLARPAWKKTEELIFAT